MRPVTLQDLADRAGVHRTTVSLALRDHPRIPAATRERIQQLAKELKYRANPLVTALMRSRRTGNAAKHAVLAYVTHHPTRFGWRPPETVQPDFFPGAAARAKDLGYKLEHFWMAEPGMSPARLSDILSTRGIHGVLVGRLPAGLRQLNLAWERFPCVALGLTLESPRLHHVAENHFYTTRHSMQQCLDRGYRRIGFAFTTPNLYPRVGDRWLGGFLCQQLQLDPGDRVPPFSGSLETPAAFLAWFERWKPDAILISRAERVREWLKEAGCRVPRDVGIVDLRNEQPDLGYAGLYHDPSKVGALAVEMLIGQAQRSENGPPHDPHEVLLTGEWLDGTTLPSRPLKP